MVFFVSIGYGVFKLELQVMLLCTATFTALMAMRLGLSWTALSGIAMGLEIPLAPVAAAVVAGSTFGDKLSPLSDTTNMAALSAGTDLYAHVRSMLWTTIPAAVVTVIIYTVYGLRFGGDFVMPENVSSMLATMDQMYTWNPLLLGHGLTAFVSGFKITMVPGLDAAATNADVLTLVQRGGLTSMSNIILTIFCAYSFAGIAEEAGFMEKIIDAVIGKIKTRGATVAAGISTAITLTIIGVSGYISLIMTGELFRKPYLKWRMDLSVLSRTCEDGGTMICSIVPFSTSGLFYAGALGVPVLSYLPWHFMAFICPILAIIYGYTGIGIKTISQEEADRQIRELGFEVD